MAAIPVTSGLQLLLDARTISASDGDKVAAWADQSGQGNDAAQATEANKPTYKTNIYGSNPAVRITDATDHMTGSFASWGSMAGATLLVCSSNIVTLNGRVFATSDGSVSDTALIMQDFTTSNQVRFFCNGTNIPGSTYNTSLYATGSPPIVYGHAVTGTRIDKIINGVMFFDLVHAIGLPAAPTIYSTSQISSGTPQATNAAKHDIHFIALYNARLSVTNLELVSHWMMTELGVRSAGGGGGSRMVNVRGGADQ